MKSMVAAFFVALIAVSPILAQPDKPTTKPKGRLPNNYGRIGLDETQKLKIYEIQSKYDKQLDDLEAQIVALKKKRDGEVEGVLTPDQKKKLSEFSGKPVNATTTTTNTAPEK